MRDVHPQLSTGAKMSALGALLLASFVYTYPLIESPARANRLDSPDAMLNSWIVSWCLYQLPRDPLHLFDANIFYPEEGSLAFSENLVTGALLAAPVALFSDSPLLLFNAVLLLGFVTTGYAAFLLAHDVTSDRLAAALAAVLFAFAPFRFAHIPHLQLQLAFGIPLSLCFTRRILGGAGGPSAALGLASVIPLTFGSSVYYSVFTATVLPLFVASELVKRAPAERSHALARFAAAAAVGSVATLPLALPYWGKLSSGTFRSLETAARFSAGGLEYLSSFSRLHGFLPDASEPLFPGVVALLLAGWAFFGKERPWIWLAIGVTGVALSLGPSLGLFSLLYEIFPPYRALRVPSRAGVVFLLAVAMLAAIGLSRLRSQRLRASLLLVAAAECFHGPLPLRMEAPATPAIYRHVEALEGDGALVELPLPPPESFQDNALYVYRSAFHRRAIVNGYSGFVPESYRVAYRALMQGPLEEGLRRLSGQGVRYVLAHEGRLGPRMIRQIEEARREGALMLIEEVGSDRLYELREL